MIIAGMGIHTVKYASKRMRVFLILLTAQKMGAELGRKGRRTSLRASDMKDEFLDPKLNKKIKDGWKFRYTRNIARTCPICFEDMNWWDIQEANERCECSNCGYEDDGYTHIKFWRKRFKTLLEDAFQRGYGRGLQDKHEEQNR